MKKRLLVFLLVLSMIISYAVPASAKTNEDGWDKDKYGDTIDIGPKLREMSKDEDMMKAFDQSLKEEAAKMSPLPLKKNALTGESPIGTQKYYVTVNTINNKAGLKSFTLRSIGKNCEVWVADKLSYPTGDSRPEPMVTNEQATKLSETFDNQVYKNDTDFFGMPQSHNGENAGLDIPDLGIGKGYYKPVDGVERVIVLVDNIVDENYLDPTYPFYVVGFYYGAMEKYVDRNVITIDADNWGKVMDKNILPTLAHEFQHLIHDDNDSAEETWINEGMADFAEYLCGFGQPEGHINYFLDHPETSLVKWDDYKGTTYGSEVLADYGQAYLFQLYLNDHFGKKFIQSLAKDTDHGINSVNKILKKYNTGIDFEELYKRFSLALAIDSSSVIGDLSLLRSKDIYKFKDIDIKINYDSAAQYNKPGLPAWGADYVELKNASKIKDIKFDGVSFLPMQWQAVDNPKEPGKKVIWGNGGDEIDNYAVFQVDLRNKTKATLSFDTLYDIEETFDFGAVQVSIDNGKTWTSLANADTRSDLAEGGYPTISKNLPGFTGSCLDWKTESFDLTPYAGNKLMIGFRYMTDWGSNGNGNPKINGWYIKNVQIPEIGYKNDCSSINGFKGLAESLNQYTKYGISFINDVSLGRDNSRDLFIARTLFPIKFRSDNPLEIIKMLNAGKNYMVIWYAAPVGDKNPIDFNYEITYKEPEKNSLKKIKK